MTTSSRRARSTIDAKVDNAVEVLVQQGLTERQAIIRIGKAIRKAQDEAANNPKAKSEVEKIKANMTNAYKGSGARIGNLVTVLVGRVEDGSITIPEVHEVLDDIERLHEQQLENIRCYRERFQGDSKPEPEPEQVQASGNDVGKLEFRLARGGAVIGKPGSGVAKADKSGQGKQALGQMGLGS